MPAQRPVRPRPGTALVMPRVGDDDTQIALDRVKFTAAQLQAQISGNASSSAPGRILHAPRLLTGTGSDTLAAGTCVVHLRGIGQGGGGGGAQSTTGVSAGAGASSGVLLDIWIGTPGTPLGTLSISWISGSGFGTGGSAVGGAGAAGADSVITIDGVAYTMRGGGGGAGCPNIVAPNNGNVMSSAPAGGTPTGGVSGYGQGNSGIVIGATAWFSGLGGGTPFGAGGGSVGGASDGQPGGGLGGGGSGGAGSGGVGHVGGAGAPGGFIIEEYS